MSEQPQDIRLAIFDPEHYPEDRAEQEWTPEDVAKMLELNRADAIRAICLAHNAAVAAAYEQGRKDEHESIRHMHES
jgi:hypothetical protein